MPQGQVGATEKVHALVLRDVARLLGRVRLTPAGDGLVPALAHADLWRVVPRLARRVADLIDAGEAPGGAGCSPEHLRHVAGLIELAPCPRGVK